MVRILGATTALLALSSLAALAPVQAKPIAAGLDITQTGIPCQGTAQFCCVCKSVKSYKTILPFTNYCAHPTGNDVQGNPIKDCKVDNTWRLRTVNRQGN